MDPKFVTLDDAAQQLNISSDQLNALREQGKLRAYRDGSSWKFRSEEIDRMASEGVPAMDEESGINLDLDDLSLGSDLSLDEADFGGTSDIDSVSFSDINLEEGESELGLSTGSSADVSLNLDDEPATPAESKEEAAELEIEPELGLASEEVTEEVVEAGESDSILISESELEDSPGRPPSTIIGRNDSEEDDALDLDVVSEGGSDEATYSDVKLADMDDFDIDDMAAATLKAESADSLGGDFENIDELELDLEAESSRILTPDDVAAAQAAAGAQAQEKAPETSDLELELEDDYTLAGSDTGLSAVDSPSDATSGSELDLDMGSKSGSGLTGISALELDDSDSDDDDFVLGDGSDVTLSPGDSGINLSPADSGLSLDDAALDLGGSSIGSGIDFGEASGLISDGPEGDFELTPMEEDAGSDDEDDSSQVIALDAFEENQEAEDLLGASSEPVDMGMGPAPVATGFSQTAVVPQAEVQFTTWQVVFLSLCLVLLSLCGMMTLDVVRSMWSWNEPYSVNSSLIDSLSGFLFP